MIRPMFPISDENERGHGPAFVSLAFIALNVFVFLVLQGGGSAEGNEFTYGYSAVPFEITNNVDLTEPEPIDFEGQQVAVPQEPGPDPIWLTLFSSIFMHGGWLHLGGNMLFLWVFGNNIEDSMGPVRFLVFYILCGLVAAGAHMLVDPASPVPTVGASGAISGVLGAYLVLYPKARVNMLFFFLIIIRVIPLPAWVVLIWWFAIQVLQGLPQLSPLRPEVSGGVAVWAHVGGFVAGVILVKLFENRALVAERKAVHDALHPDHPYRTARWQ